MFRRIRAGDDAAIAKIIRDNLEASKLDIPGTVYFDDTLDHLSQFYLANPKTRFYYIGEEEGRVFAGVGLAECPYYENCAELQKLYLADWAKGKGLGYRLMELIEAKAIELGYHSLYLETHTNLEIAMHLYERCGYELIEKPEAIVHSAMNRFYRKELKEE